MRAVYPVPGIAEPARAPRRSTVGRRLILLGLSLALSWAVVEVLIHGVEMRTGPLFFGGLSNPEYNPDFVRPHPVLGVEHVPDSGRRYGFPEHPAGVVELRNNNLGLREDAPTELAKAPDTYRVLVLGDSQTDGLVYNAESFVNVAEARLNERSPRPDGRRWELLNAGVITYQPVQSYLWWRAYGRALHADAVVLVLYAGNDLLDASTTRVRLAPDGSVDVDTAAAPVVEPSFKQTVLRHCRTCVLASLPLRGGPLEDVLVRAGLVSRTLRVGSVSDSDLLKAHRTCRGCMWQSLNQRVRYDAAPAQYARDVQALKGILARLRGEVHASGAPLALVLLPSKLQVEGDVVPEMAEIAGVLGVVEYQPPIEDRVLEDLRRAATALDVPALDVTPMLVDRYASDSEALYYRIDWHLNTAGHAAAGEALAQWVAATLEPSSE